MFLKRAGPLELLALGVKIYKHLDHRFSISRYDSQTGSAEPLQSVSRRRAAGVILDLFTGKRCRIADLPGARRV